MRLNEVITKIHESENHLIICEEKMNELLNSINLVLNEDVGKTTIAKSFAKIMLNWVKVGRE